MPEDIDGDGVTDISVHDSIAEFWVTCSVDGNGDVEWHPAGNADPEWTADTTDRNGDGRDDFLLYNPASGAWLEALSDVAGDFSSTRKPSGR